jgi:hypothetical protein
VRRVLLAVCVVVFAVAVAGCGSGGAGSSATEDPPAAASAAPAPAVLASNALAALKKAGSAHVDASLASPLRFGSSSPSTHPGTLRFSGDASQDELAGEASIEVGSFAIKADVRAGDKGVFLKFNDEWYGDTSTTVAKARKKVQSGDDAYARLARELQTPEGLRKRFDDLVDGVVVEGPRLDGHATWELRGRLSADGIAATLGELGKAPTQEQRDVLEEAVKTSRVRLAVDKDDWLPRRIFFSARLTAAQVRKLGDESGKEALPAGAWQSRATILLSDFGTDVDASAPSKFEPLDQLLSGLFGG